MKNQNITLGFTDEETCSHKETVGTSLEKGIKGVCKVCLRDLDLWDKVQSLSEKIESIWIQSWKIWVRDTAMSNSVSKCCQDALYVDPKSDMWHCSKCKRLI